MSEATRADASARRDPQRESQGRVDVVTGLVWEDAPDVWVDGVVPLAWTRIHTTLPRAAPGPLGWGATHGFDHALQVEPERVRYASPDGIAARFEGTVGETTLSASVGPARWTLERRGAHTFVVHRGDEGAFEFHAVGTSTEVVCLVAVHSARNTLHLRYNGTGRLRAVLDPAGRMLRLEYDRADRVERVVLAGHRSAERTVAEYGYDARGDLVRAVDAYGTVHTRTYDLAHRCVRHTDSRGRGFSYEYDALGRCVYASGDDGLLATRLRYDPASRRTEVTTAGGGTWVVHYDEEGLITTLDDPAQLRVPLSARAATRAPATRWAPSSAAALAWGKLLAVAGETPDVHGLSAQGRSTEARTKIAVASEAAASLDGAGLGAIKQRPLSPTEQRDEFGRLVRETRADGSTKQWHYGGATALLRVVDGRGGATEFDQAHGTQLRVHRDALGNTTRLAWTLEGRVATVIDPSGERAELRYDRAGRCVGLRDGRRRVERYAFDPQGRLVELRDGERALVFRQTFERDGRAMSRDYADGTRTAFRFDLQGRVESIDEESGSLRFAYDLHGERTTDLRDGRGVRHHDAGPAGRRTTVLGRYSTLTRVDDEGTVHITDPTGAVHRVRRPKVGVIVRDLANGHAELAQYDVQGRCLSKSAYGGSAPGASAWERAYLRDAEGALIEVRDSARGTRWFTHDLAGRLVHTRDARGREDRFAHDAAGNVYRAGDGEPARWGGDHQLLAHRGVHFTDDARGRRASRASAQQAPVQYRYDAHDRLVGIDGLPEPWSARYDALGRRIEKRVGDAVTRFWWDGDRLAAVEFPSAVVRVYVYPDPHAWVPLLWVDYDGAETALAQGRRYTPVGDALGAPLEVRDDRGNVVWQARIDPYGHAKIDPTSTHEQPLRRPGEYADPEAGGLLSQGPRTWDPATARYLQPLLQGSTLACSPYVGPASPVSEVLLAGLYPMALNDWFARHDHTGASRANPHDALLDALYLAACPSSGSLGDLVPERRSYQSALDTVLALALVQIAPAGRVLEVAQREALGFTDERALQGAPEARLRRLVSEATEALARHDRGAARSLLERARETAALGGQHALAISLGISVAGLLIDEGDILGALERYRHSASRAEQRSLPLLAWQAHTGAARAAARGRLVADADAAHERAAQTAERAGLCEELCESLSAKGSHLLAHGNEPDALSTWTRAFETGAALPDEPWTRGSLPETHRRMTALLERRGLHARAQQLRAFLRTSPSSSPGGGRR